MPDCVTAAWCPLDNKSDRKCYQSPCLPRIAQQIIKAEQWEQKH